MPYLAVFLVLLGVSVGVFSLAAHGHDERAGRNNDWMIGWQSWFGYAILGLCAAALFGLNEIAGGIIGFVAGPAGTFVWFIYAMCTSKNGVK